MSKRLSDILKTILGLVIICVHILPFYIVVSVAFKAPQDLSSRWVMPFYFFNRSETGQVSEDVNDIADDPQYESENTPTDEVLAESEAPDMFLFDSAADEYEYDDFYAEDLDDEVDLLFPTGENEDVQSDTETTDTVDLPPIYLDNFKEAWVTGDLGRALLNNTIISFLTVILVIIIGACAAYPLSRHRTRLNNFMYNFFVSCLIVPALTILVPLYKLMVDIGGINTHWGMILTLVTFQLPLSIFLFTGFIGSIPKELDEAALVDGCGRFSIFLRIIFPVLKPVTATVAILVSVNAWNDYQFSIFFLQTPSMYTISVAVAQFTSQFISNVGMVAAACIISAIPATIVFLCLQKYFIKGLTAGAVKG